MLSLLWISSIGCIVVCTACYFRWRKSHYRGKRNPPANWPASEQVVQQQPDDVGQLGLEYHSLETYSELLERNEVWSTMEMQEEEEVEDEAMEEDTEP